MKHIQYFFLSVLILFFISNICEGQTQTVTFNYTGGLQTWVVPPCITSINVTVAGAKGGGSNGGLGARITATLNVTPGQMLQIRVGGMGGCPAAGYNGGGSGANANTSSNGGCGGGGASDIRIAPYGLNNRLIVAAGGGGMGGGDTDAMGGGGGCNSGNQGTSPFGVGGGGASQTAGGTGGPPWISSGYYGGNGAIGQGGNGASDPCYNKGPGGGGGGGYYGGGGGGSDCYNNIPLGGGGGGGGSSLVPTGGSCSAGNNGSNGYVTITYTPVNANPTASNTGPYCTGQAIQLNATGGGTYSWTGPNGFTSTAQNPIIGNSQLSHAGTYTVTININGCTGTASTNVVVNQGTPASVTASGPTTFCQGGSVSLTSSSGTAYNWSTSATSQTITASTSGTYVVTVTSSNGCTASNSIAVTVNPLPAASAGSNASICIGNNIQLNASGGTSYQWSPSASLSNSTISNPVANPSTTTTYTVTVTNASACSATSSMVLSVNPLPNPSAGNNASICQGSNAQLNASGGSSYLWSPSSGLSAANISNPLASPVNTTTYTVTVTNANTCSATSSVVVTVNSVPQASAGNNVSICSGNSTPLNASGGSTYAWSPAIGLSATNISNPIANPTATTTYSVTVTAFNGCSATSSMVLTVNPLPNASAGQNKTICTGTSVTLDGSGGTAYAWAPASSLSNHTIATPSATPTVTTTYTVTVTNTFGCTATCSAVVFVNMLPSAGAGTNTSICLGHSTTLNASGGVNYHWSPANSLNNPDIANPVATPTTTTTYSLTVTDANSCTGTSNLVVTVNTLPPANAGTNQIICLNQSVNLTASGGIQYLWSNSATTQSINVSPATSITYIVTVTDNNGCSATDDVSVTVNTLPPANAGQPQSICIGNNTTLSASGGTSYLWAPAACLNNCSISTPIASPSITTTYTVTVTDNNGCTASSSMILTVNSLPMASAGSNQDICRGTSCTLNATGGLIYQWSPATNLNNPNISNPIANPSLTTTYTVTITDNNNCSATNSMVLYVHAPPTADAGNDLAICLNGNTTLNASGGLFYAWSPATGLSNTNTSDPLASPTITTTYTVTVTDNNTCTATDNMILTVNPLPPANAGSNLSICYGTSALLNASGGVLYTWAPSATLSNASVASPVATPTVTTTYTVMVTDSNGCSESDDVIVNIWSLPPANAGTNTAICEGNNALLTASGGIMYEWSNGDTTENITVSPPSNTTYVVTVTDGNGCSQTDDVIVNVNFPPPANAGNDVSICLGLSTSLNASGGISYNWSPSTSLSSTTVANPTASPSVQTTYTVTVTDVNSCSATDDVIVSIFPSPIIAFSADVYNGCEPLIVNFIDSSQFVHTWQWEFGDPASGVMNTANQQNPAHLFINPGTYSITLLAVSSDGCQKTATYNNMITVYPNPVAAFTSDPQFGTIENPFISFLDNSLNAWAWYWNFGDPTSNTNNSTVQNPSHMFTTDGNYLVTLMVQSEYGCVDSASTIIRIHPEFSIYIPNAFTPNGDGINDVFKAYGASIAEFNMYIYNRWGELLFESNNINIGWDGRTANSYEPLMQDVYIYKIIAVNHMGKKFNYVGKITLLN